MGGQAGLKLADLAVQFGEDAHGGAGGGAEGVGDRGGGRKLLGAQRGADFTRPGGDVAFPSTAFEGGLDRRHVQVSAQGGGGSAVQHPERVAVGQVLECLQRGGVVLA
jgi:hypothetical protein